MSRLPTHFDFDPLETPDGWIRIRFVPKPHFLRVIYQGSHKREWEGVLTAMLTPSIDRYVGEMLKRILCEGDRSVLISKRPVGRPREPEAARVEERQKTIDRLVKAGIRIKRRDPKAKFGQREALPIFHYTDERNLRGMLTALGIDWRRDILDEIKNRTGN